MKAKNQKDYIIMNADGEFFAGLMYGGKFMFTSDINEAKPMYDDPDLHKLKMMKHFLNTEDLIHDFI